MKNLAVISVGLGLVVGCSNSNHDHDHHEEPKTTQITVWTDRYEVFAEHRAPVVSNATTFITHVTDLHTLHPRREGAVIFVLRQGETVREHVEETPARAGIYLPEIIFPSAGGWQLTLLIPTENTNAVVELGTINVYADQHSGEHAEFSAAPEGVSFLKEQQWNILSKTEPASIRHLVERVRVPARVRAKPGFSSTVVAPLSGKLVALDDRPLPQPGQLVNSGQLLALLKPNFSEVAARMVEAEAEFATAKAALDQAETAHARTKKLADDQAKSPRELQESELALQSAKARYSAAAGLLATFRHGGIDSPDGPMVVQLQSPITGVLNSIAAGPGEVVAANQSLFTVLNPETVWIEAQIPEASVPMLGDASDAAVELPGDEKQLISIASQGRGQLISLGLEVDAVTRAVPLIYELVNKDGQFRIGQNVTLHVETTRAQDAVAIPHTALVEEGGLFVAFVQVAGETFQKRELRLGIRDGDWIQVLSGVSEGERVVTKGAYAVRLASASGVIPAHSHAH